MPKDETGLIRVSAVVLRGADGRVLTVRKAGTTRFMLPGGKPEPGESPEHTALREVAEELGLRLAPAGLRRLGVFRAAAANEPGHDVESAVFTHPAVPEPTAAAEIEETRWLDLDAPLPADLAPMLSGHVVPALRDTATAHPIVRVTVFTGSATGTDPRYQHAAVAFGAALADRGIGLAYGGARLGLMGLLADAVLRDGGEVHGVMPEALVAREIAHSGLTVLDVVSDMHERKQRMAMLGDAFVALPGGAGTLEEFFEAWTWQQLGIHAKPVGLLNVDGFWDDLLHTVDGLVDRGFMAPSYRDSLVVAADPDALLDALTRWRAPAPKWGKTSRD